MLCAAPKVVNRRQYFQVDRSEGAIHTARKFTLEAAKTMSAVCVPSCQPEQHRSAAERVSRAEVLALFALSFNDLLARAHDAHRAYHDANAVQVSTLLSIKTGGCPEDCAYCPQSARYATGVKAEKLMSLDTVVDKAKQAKAAGATRFCMGAAWRSPKDRDVEKVAQMVSAVRALGMETCATLGMLSTPQAQTLKSAGLQYYNHKLD